MKRKINLVDFFIVLSLVLLVIALFLPSLPASHSTTGIADADGDGQVMLSDYSGKKIGSITGVNYDSIIDECVPGAEVEYFSNYSDLVVALKAGLIYVSIILLHIVIFSSIIAFGQKTAWPLSNVGFPTHPIFAAEDCCFITIIYNCFTTR